MNSILTSNVLRFNIVTVPECLTETGWANYSKKRMRERKAEKSDDIDGTFKNYREKAYIYPEFSKVVAISYTTKDDNGVITNLLGENERYILEEFCKVLEKYKTFRLGGYNIYGYAIPFLWKRCVINQMKPHKALCIAGIKPRDADMVFIDVMNERKQTSFTCSLDLLCETLLGENPNYDGIGEHVHSAVIQDNYDRVGSYSADAVSYTIRCYERIMCPEPETAKDIAEKKMAEPLPGDGDDLPF